jgi:hypothetical protein
MAKWFGLHCNNVNKCICNKSEFQCCKTSPEYGQMPHILEHCLCHEIRLYHCMIEWQDGLDCIPATKSELK